MDHAHAAEGAMHSTPLRPVADELTKQAAAASAGRAAKRVYGGSDLRLSQTLIALTAGSSLSEHDNPGEATIAVVRGHVRLRAGDASADGNAGDLLVVPPQRHSLEAIEDSTIVLTAVRTQA